MKLLHVDSSILGDNSVSRQIAAAVVERLRAADPGAEIFYRDLAADPLDHLTLGTMAGSPTEGGAQSQATLDQFLAADTVVIGAPMYNFTIPTQLKAWIDRILVAGKTFQYGENGVQGLATGKRVIVVVSRGGYYRAGTPMEALEHLESYLRGVFGFIGIAPEFISADGIQVSPDHRQSAIGGAIDAVALLEAA
jgi:FMN-dependent NADH-azoreductase